MILSLKEVGSNHIVRVNAEKIICYFPNLSNSEFTTHIFLEHGTSLKVWIKPEELDKILSTVMAVKDQNGHLVRPI